jgi:hypothetical protein
MKASRVISRICPSLVCCLCALSATERSPKALTMSPLEGEWEAKVYEIEGGYATGFLRAAAPPNKYSLEVPNRLEISPSQLVVSENATNRVPGIEAVAGIAYAVGEGPKETRIDWKWLIEAETGGSGHMTMRGMPGRDEFEKIFPGDEYPPEWEDIFTSDNLKTTFDVEATGEAFNEGANKVELMLWGTTYIAVNKWDPVHMVWERCPAEVRHFAERTSTDKDVWIAEPYRVWKSPNLDYVKQPHQASLTVELWDKNLAQLSAGGNIQSYFDPRVRRFCENGTIPPADGTGNNQVKVCSDTRIHTGDHPPVEVHVIPDFDPIEVTVKHLTWDLAENRGKIYQRRRVLTPTQLWCVQPGSPDSIPTPPDTVRIPEPIPEKTQTPRRTIETPPPRINDPEVGGPVGTNVSIEVELVSLTLHAAPETLQVDGREPRWICPECVLSGDDVELRYRVRDNFGRHFAGTIPVHIPAPEDLQAPDTLYLPQPMLQLVDREIQQTAVEPVEIVVLDLAGLAFGEVRPVSQVMIRDAVSMEEYTTDAAGMVHHQAPFGSHFQLQVGDPQQRYLPMNLPLSPEIRKPLIAQSVPDAPGFQDDRCYIWLNPSWNAGPLAFGAGSIRQEGPGYDVRIGAVSALNPATVAQADFRFLGDDSVIGPATVGFWGATDQGNYGFVPALFGLEGGNLTTPQIQRIIQDGGVVLCVRSTEYLDDLRLQIPVTFLPAASIGGGDARGADFELLPPAPNPTTASTLIQYRIPAEGPVRLAVYDVRGREVALLRRGTQPAGEHRLTWNPRDAGGDDAASGVYFLRLEFDGSIRSRRLLLAR